MQQRTILDADVQKVHQVFVRHMVKESPYVGIDNMVDRLEYHQIIQLLQGLMGVALRTEAEGLIREVLLIDTFKYPRDTALDDLVLDRRDPQRTELAAPFRDVYPPSRNRTKAFRFQPLDQRVQVLLQIFRIPIPAPVILPHRLIPVKAHEALSKERSVQQMSQARKLHRGIPLRVFRYQGKA